MKTGLALAISVALNIGLVAFHFARTSPAPSQQSTSVALQQSTPEQKSTKPKVIRLDWRFVESSDYKEYVRNLRSIGCPKETIFDIIVADVNTLFAMKARTAAPQGEWKYWEAEDEAPSREDIRNQKLRRDLEKQKRALIAEILGADAVDKMKKYQLWGGEELVDRKLAFLSAEKREKLKALQEKYFELEQDAMDWDANGLPTGDANQRLSELQKQKRAELEGLLTANELTEYDLRTSETASHLRHELNGFHPTEHEFRELYKFRTAYEQSMTASSDIRDPNVMQNRMEMADRLTQQSKATLGADRYADYARSQDLDYQNALRLANYFGLPEQSATAVYDLKRRNDAEAERLNNMTGLSDDDREKALQNLATQTEKELIQALGEQAFGVYRQSNRWWMRN